MINTGLPTSSEMGAHGMPMEGMNERLWPLGDSEGEVWHKWTLRKILDQQLANLEWRERHAVGLSEAGGFLDTESKQKSKTSRLGSKGSATLLEERSRKEVSKAIQLLDEPRVFREELFDGSLFPEQPPKTPTRKRPARNLTTQTAAEPTPATEGERAAVTRYAPVRNSNLRKAAIRIHGSNCSVCNASFDKTYGPELARGYIEIHHLKSIAHGERETNPITDLAPLCANCHRMADRVARECEIPPQTIEELKKALIPSSEQEESTEDEQ
jgi:predicted restriction endonuclease